MEGFSCCREWRHSEASGARGSNAELGHSNVPEVDVNWKGTREDQNSACSVEDSQKMKERAAMRKESAETQDDVSCQDMEVDENKSLEEMGFVPSSVNEPFRVNHMCDKKRYEREFKFYQLAAIVTEEGGTPHTINLCNNCFDCRRTGRISLNKDNLRIQARKKVRECYSEVEQEDEDRKSIAQLILQKSSDSLRRIIVPVEGQGEVTLSCVFPQCHRYPP